MVCNMLCLWSLLFNSWNNFALASEWNKIICSFLHIRKYCCAYQHLFSHGTTEATEENGWPKPLGCHHCYVAVLHFNIMCSVLVAQERTCSNLLHITVPSNNLVQPVIYSFCKRCYNKVLHLLRWISPGRRKNLLNPKTLSNGSLWPRRKIYRLHILLLW